MLAYLFWHRPRSAIDVSRSEAALCKFHETLEADLPDAGPLAVRIERHVIATFGDV